MDGDVSRGDQKEGGCSAQPDYFGEEMDRMEAKWEANVEDANEEIARLQQEVKRNKKTLGTTIEKSVTLGLEVKNRGKEIPIL